MHQLLILLLSIFILAACDRAPAPSEPQTPTPQTATAPAPDAAPAEQQAATTPVDGENVFKQVCTACHGMGIAGAPKLGDPAQWKARLAQGPEKLLQHAIEGYTGSQGTMPPRGGKPDLSDAEVKAAVDFMLSRLPGN